MKKVITLLFTILFTSFLLNCEEMTEPIMNENIFLRGSVVWYGNNKVREGILNDNHTISNINFKYNTTIYFHSNGLIWNGNLNGNQSISNINFRDGGYIVFYPNGLIKSGDLNGNQTIQGSNYTRSWIAFDSNGNIQL